MGTNLTASANNTTGLVVNDPMGLCMVAEGTLVVQPQSVSSPSSLPSSVPTNNEEQIRSNTQNSSNYGTYTNIIQLTRQLFVSSTKSSTTIKKEPALTSSNSSNSTTTASNTTSSTEDVTSSTTNNHNNIDTSDPRTSTTTPNDIRVVVTIEMDDSTIFVTNYSDTSHSNNNNKNSNNTNQNDYTMALQLPNTIATVTTTNMTDEAGNDASSPSQLPSAITHEMTTEENTKIANTNDMVASTTVDEESVQRIESSLPPLTATKDATTTTPSSTMLDDDTLTNTTATTTAMGATSSDMEHAES